MTDNTPKADCAESPIRSRLGLAVVLIAIGPFLLCLFNDFVYDDHFFVKGNAWVQSWSNLGPLLMDPETNSMGGAEQSFWRPLRNLHYLTDYTIAGRHPAWYHFVNLLWHGAAALGLFAFLRRLGLSGFAAFTAAALFAAHPAQTESVAWIKERDGLMAGAFLFWALYHALGRGGQSVAFSLALAVMAMLSKEHAVVYTPLAGLGLLVQGGTSGGRDNRRLGTILFGGTALTLVFLGIRHFILGGTAQTAEPPGGTWGATMATMPEVFLRYLRVMLLPVHFPITYEWIRPNGWTNPATLAGIAVLGILIGVGVFLWRRAPRAAFGLAWFLVCLLPFSNLVPMTQWMAVRFLYLPLAGAGILAALAIERWAAPSAWRPAALLIGFLAYLSLNETLVWRNDLTLWENTYRIVVPRNAITVRPGAERPVAFYAEHLNRFGFHGEALWATMRFPYNANRPFEELAWKARVDAQRGLGFSSDALSTARHSVGQTPTPRLFLLLGFLEMRKGNSPEAIAAWEHGLELDPYNRNLIENLIFAYQEAGRGGEARELEALRQRMATQPRSQW